MELSAIYRVKLAVIHSNVDLCKVVEANWRLLLHGYFWKRLVNAIICLMIGLLASETI